MDDTVEREGGCVGSGGEGCALVYVHVWMSWWHSWFGVWSLVDLKLLCVNS